MKKTYIIITIAALAGIWSCKKGEPIIIHNPAPWNEEATLTFTSGISQTAAKGASTVEFPFVSSQESFTVSCDREWCSAHIEANNKVVVSVDANKYDNERIAKITVVAGIYDNVSAPQTLLVRQAAGDTKAPKVGDLYGSGIVYWASTSADTAGFRVVSLKRLYGINAQWSTELKEVGFTDKNYGINNVRKITDMNEHPAFNFCDTLTANHGQGWYLPAQNEFYDIMVLYNGGIAPQKALPNSEEVAKRAAFEALLAANGGDPFNTAAANDSGESYWTSTEVNREDAIYVRVGKYAMAAASKTGSARGARCIQYFDLR